MSHTREPVHHVTIYTRYHATDKTREEEVGEDKRDKGNMEGTLIMFFSAPTLKVAFLSLLVIPANNKIVMSHKVAFHMVDSHRYETSKRQKGGDRPQRGKFKIHGLLLIIHGFVLKSNSSCRCAVWWRRAGHPLATDKLRADATATISFLSITVVSFAMW